MLGKAHHQYRMWDELIERSTVEKHLHELLDKMLNMSQQHALALQIANPRPTPGHKRQFSLSSAAVRPYLKYCVQFYGPQHHKDMAISAQVHSRATKLIRGMQHLSCEKRIK